MRFAHLALTLAAVLPASAVAQEPTTGLAWQWDGQERRYQIRADVTLSEMMMFKKDNNADIRVAQFQLGLITTCKPKATVGKHTWEVACTLDDVQLLGAPPRADAGKLLPVLDEIDEKLSNGGWVQLTLTADGRLKNVDLEGLDKSNRRINEIHESIRLVLARAFSAFDLQMPKNGDDRGRKTWEQSGTPTMGFPSEYGTMGMTDLQHTLAGQEGLVVEITTQGRGVVGPGEMIAVRAGEPERQKNTYDTTIRGVAEFDLGSGTIVDRQYLVEAIPTPSAIISEGGMGVSYVQAVRLQLLPPGEEPPKFGPNEELGAADRSTLPQ